MLGVDPKKKQVSMTENEFREILDVSHDEGFLETEERRIITNVVDFGDSLAKDVMVPRIDMAFANVDLTYDELVEAFAEDKYTRLPVYSESRDNVIGVVNLKDLFFYNGSKEDFHITDIMREAYFTYVYACQAAEVEVDLRTGKVEVLKVAAAHDVGRAINPQGVAGQICGGVVMAMGYALMEDLGVKEACISNRNFDEYLLPTALDVHEVVPIIVENPDMDGPYGAKSIGEPSTELGAAAIINAVNQAIGRKIRQLPASLEMVLLGQSLDKDTGRGSELAHG